MDIETNSEMSSKETEEFVMFDKTADAFLAKLDAVNLSPRGYYRVLKVARTIADLEKKDGVSAEHLAEAFSYRLRDEPVPQN